MPGFVQVVLGLSVAPRLVVDWVGATSRTAEATPSVWGLNAMGEARSQSCGREPGGLLSPVPVPPLKPRRLPQGGGR